MSDRRLGQGMIGIGVVMWIVIFAVMAATKDLPYDDRLDTAWVLAIPMMIGGALIPCGIFQVFASRKD